MEKETLEKIKNGFVALLKKAGVITMAVLAAKTLTACNKTDQQVKPDPNPNPGGEDKPPVVVTQTNVIDILSEMQAFENLNVEEAYDSLAVNIAAEKLFESTVLGYEYNGSTLSIVAKSKNGGDLTSVSVSVPNSAMKYIKMNEESLKTAVLLLAGYTPTSTVENKAEAEQKLTSAINKVVSDIASGKDCSTNALNDYAVDGANINLSKVFPGQTVKGYVREDGTVLAYVYGDNSLTEHHYHFAQKGLYPNQMAEIIQNGEKGVDYTEDLVEIDFSQTHTPPALDEPQIEEKSFDELYAQVFGDNYSLPTFAELMDELLPKLVAGSDLKVLFTGFEGDDFYIYSESVNSLGVKGFYKSLYRGDDFHPISEYRDATSPIVEQGIKEILKETYTELGLSEQEILDQLTHFKLSAESCVDAIRNMGRPEFKSSTLFLDTREFTDYKPYAEKLYGDKEIIYAGVSDLGGASIDEFYFDTGSCNTFKILSIYKEDGNVIIDIKEIVVPQYNNSTTESLYNSFLEKDVYKVLNEQTIEVSDPVEVQRLQEFIAKLEKFSQYEIGGLDGLAEDEEERARLYRDAYEALWLSLDAPSLNK